MSEVPILGLGVLSKRKLLGLCEVLGSIPSTTGKEDVPTPCMTSCSDHGLGHLALGQTALSQSPVML